MRTLIGLSCLALALAADEGSKHYHGGKLSKYEIGPPALLLSDADEARLRSGRSVMQTVESEDADSKRLIMVADIKAPASIVLGCARPSDCESLLSLSRAISHTLSHCAH